MSAPAIFIVALIKIVLVPTHGFCKNVPKEQPSLLYDIVYYLLVVGGRRDNFYTTAILSNCELTE